MNKNKTTWILKILIIIMTISIYANYVNAVTFTVNNFNCTFVSTDGGNANKAEGIIVIATHNVTLMNITQDPQVTTSVPLVIANTSITTAPMFNTSTRDGVTYIITNNTFNFTMKAGVKYLIYHNGSAGNNARTIRQCASAPYAQTHINATGRVDGGGESAGVYVQSAIILVTTNETLNPPIYYTIRGTVLDGSTPQENATVDMKHLSTNTTYSVLTNVSGRFGKTDLTLTGMYSVTSWLFSNYSLQPVTHYVNVSVAN